MTARFAHLHVRSGFSYGYGVATPEELLEAAGRRGMSSLAITDRDGLYGVPRFLKTAGELGVSPIVGAEVTMEGGGHVVLLVESAGGYRSLSQLITAYRCNSAERRRPLCPLATLLEHAGGLVCLTGAIPFGLLPRLVLCGDREGAERTLGQLLEAFGQQNVFVELTDDRSAGSRRRLGRVAGFARERGVPTIVTNEVAYIRPRDHRLHEVLVAASNLTRLPGPGYRPTDQLHLKPPQKMKELFRDHPEALRNAEAVSERCSGAVRLTGTIHTPTVLPVGGGDARGEVKAPGRGRSQAEVWGEAGRGGGPQAAPGAEVHLLFRVRRLLPPRPRSQGDRRGERHPRHGEGERRQLASLVLPRAHEP